MPVVYQLLANKPAQILTYNSLSLYNSLSASIHLYMIRAIVVIKQREDTEGEPDDEQCHDVQAWLDTD